MDAAAWKSDTNFCSRLLSGKTYRIAPTTPSRRSPPQRLVVLKHFSFGEGTIESVAGRSNALIRRALDLGSKGSTGIVC